MSDRSQSKHDLPSIDPSVVSICAFGWFGTLMDDLAGMQACLVDVVGNQRVHIDLEGMALAWRKEIWRGMRRKYEPWQSLALTALRRTCVAHRVRWTGWQDLNLGRVVERWPLFDEASLINLLPRKTKTVVLSQLDTETLAPCLPNLACRFDWLFTSDRVHVYKPAASYFRLLMTQLPIEEPEEVVVVSADRTADLEPAAALGFQTILIDHDEDNDEIPTLGEAIRFLRQK